LRYLLDTNVLSELFKKTPGPKVLKWFDEINEDSLYLSVLTLGEIRKGIEKMDPGLKKTRLIHFMDKEVAQEFAGRILPVDEAVAETWRQLGARSARSLPTVDALIGATALTHNLTLVTRNTQDFGFSNLRRWNPWL
jgi:toxin FitB